MFEIYEFSLDVRSGPVYYTPMDTNNQPTILDTACTCEPEHFCNACLQDRETSQLIYDIQLTLENENLGGNDYHERGVELMKQNGFVYTGAACKGQCIGEGSYGHDFYCGYEKR